jgi:hypothetical protein
VTNKIALALLPAAGLVAVGLVGLRMHFQPPTVPEYTMAPAASAEITLAPGDAFALELRPTAPVTGAVAARGFLVRGEEVRSWTAPFTTGPDGTTPSSVAADGSVHIEGTVASLFAGVPPGDWEVAIAVGRPENLPTAPRDVLRARDADPRALSWRLVRERVFLGS